MQGEEADSVYESMAHLSTDLLMKCSLNPGCDEELYESMAAFVPAATEDLCKSPGSVLLLSFCWQKRFFLLLCVGEVPYLPLPQLRRDEDPILHKVRQVIMYYDKQNCSPNFLLCYGKV